MKKETNENLEHFERRTYKEVTIWDWLGRILPMTVLAVLSIIYLLGREDLFGIAIQVSTIIFFIICFIWWYWAIFKIAVMVKYLRSSQRNFQSLLEEFHRVKEDFKNRR